MALKNIDKPFKSSFTEDDVYHYSRDDLAESAAVRFIARANNSLRLLA
jgi:hypothetical protein